MSSPSSSGSVPPPPSSRREPAPESSRRRGSSREGVHACVFWLGGERLALDTVDLLEAIALSQVVPVPLSPPWLIGLTSLRGTPVPVVDLPTVLALPIAAAREREAVGPALVLRVDGMLLAGRVDRIEAVYAFEGARFEAGSAAEHPAVRGQLEVGQGRVPATLLDHAELSRRVNELRFRSRWEPGSEGETPHVPKA